MSSSSSSPSSSSSSSSSTTSSSPAPTHTLHPQSDFPKDTCTNSWASTCSNPALCAYTPCNICCHLPRKLTSNHKKRYEEGGFDLDLVYLTSDKRIIVHGFPATGVEHFYRNPRYEVRRFLEEKHAGKYKIFNMCSEAGRGYDHSIFEGRVERYPFRDHGVPMLTSLVYCMESAKEWLDADPENVCCFHCKAGKGRAGTMSVCFLLRAGYYDTADECLQHYNRERVKNMKGLTVASQIKYVHFYEEMLSKYIKFPSKKSSLKDTPSLLQQIASTTAATTTTCIPQSIVERNPNLNIEQPTYTIVKVEVMNLEAHAHALQLPDYSTNNNSGNQVIMSIAQGTNFEPILKESSIERSENQQYPYTYYCNQQQEQMSAVNGNYRISFHHQQPKKILGILPSTKMKNKLLFEFWSNTLFLNDVGASGSIEVDFFRDCDVKNRIGKKIRENIEGKKEKLKGKEDKKTTGIQLITLGKDEQQQKDEEGGVGEKKKLLPLPSLRIHVVRGSVRVGKETALARVTGGDEEATL